MMPLAVTADLSAAVLIGWSARVAVASLNEMASTSEKAAPALMMVRFT